MKWSYEMALRIQYAVDNTLMESDNLHNKIFWYLAENTSKYLKKYLFFMSDCIKTYVPFDHLENFYPTRVK